MSGADLREADLSRATLINAKLSGVDLRGADLREADLSRATLINAKLSGADLREADLREAKLWRANLSGANLWKADLSEADLSNSIVRNANLGLVIMRDINLSGADLSRVDLSGANLSGGDLSGANLGEANLSGGDLSGADLRRAKLRGGDLSGADLRRAKLRGGDLREADLRRAKLREVDLSGSNLSGAKLRETDLRQADLSVADLTGAYITEANLEEANLSHAEFSATGLLNVDLSAVKGLETIYHGGPSYIDVQTLYHFKGEIPEVFLRGCGFPNNFIEFTRGLFGKVTDFYSCFISHTHFDKRFARRLYDTLQGQGVRCWIDEKNIRPGEDIRAAVTHGIHYWDKFIVICSKKSLTTSHWVEEEIENALQKEEELRRQRDDLVHQRRAAGEDVNPMGEPLAIIPVMVDDFLLRGYTGRYKSQLARRLAVDFTGWDGEGGNTIFERGVEAVIRGIRTDGGTLPPPTPRLLPDDYIE